MKRSSWLEAAVNGAAGRARRPPIPVTTDEIIAEAGAGIIRLHVYDGNGAPVEDAELCARVIEGVRAAP